MLDLLDLFKKHMENNSQNPTTPPVPTAQIQGTTTLPPVTPEQQPTQIINPKRQAVVDQLMDGWDYSNPQLANLQQQLGSQALAEGFKKGLNSGSTLLKNLNTSIKPAETTTFAGGVDSSTPVNNTATIKPIVQQEPKHPYMDAFKEVMGHPITRGLITGGLVLATGGNPLDAITYGSQAGIKNMQYKQQDSSNRASLQQYGIDTSKMSGYLTDDRAKQYIEDYSKFDTLNNKKAQIESTYKIATMKDKRQQAKQLMDDLKSGMRTPEDTKALAESVGLTLGDLQKSNKTNLTESQINKNDAETEYIQGAKTDNTNADTGYKNVMSNEQQKRTGIQQQNADSNSTRAGAYATKSANGGSTKLESNPDYRNHLSEYNSIKSSGDKNKINYARNQFMKFYGIDPEKKLKSDGGDLLEFMNK